MKKIITAYILLCVVFTACKKENKQATPPNGKLYNVTFNISGFTQQHDGFLSTNDLKANSDVSSLVEVTADTATRYKVLYIYPYNIIQYEGDSDFGTFTKQLVAGTYTLTFICGENDFPKNGSGLGTTFFPFDAGQALQYKNVTAGSKVLCLGNDLFVKKFTFTVGHSDVNEDVSLDRVMGKVDIDVQDAIPANTSYILVSFNPVASQYSTIYNAPVIQKITLAESFTIKSSQIGMKDFDMSTLVMNTTKPFAVTISAYSGGTYPTHPGTLVATKTISNVTCPANVVTILQGNLFGGTGTGVNGSITVKGDTTWSTAPPAVFHF